MFPTQGVFSIPVLRYDSRVSSTYIPFVRILSFGIYCILSACSSVTPAPIPLETSYAARRKIIDQCGTIGGESADSVTEFIRTRLLTSLTLKNLPQYPIEITLVACSEPMAFSLGNGQILFSQGLVKRLPNESELAFVLAHELAHEILKHQENMSSENIEPSPAEFARGMELDADRAAIGLVAYAGYDPRSASLALSHLTKIGSDEEAVAGHPSTAERVAQLGDVIRRSGWQPPGIINRRSYQQLRLQILDAPQRQLHPAGVASPHALP